MSPEKIPPAVPIGILLFFGMLFLLVGVTKGITFQWDIGNFAVGLGTLAVAVATIMSVQENKSVKIRELKKLSEIKIAEFRMQWVEELRSEVSEYLSLVRDITSRISIIDWNDDNFEYYHDKFINLDKIAISIELRMNKNDEVHQKIINTMGQCRSYIVDFGPNIGEKNKKSKLRPIVIPKYIDELTTLFHKIEKTEWSRVKSEIREGN